MKATKKKGYSKSRINLKKYQRVSINRYERRNEKRIIADSYMHNS